MTFLYNYRDLSDLDYIDDEVDDDGLGILDSSRKKKKRKKKTFISGTVDIDVLLGKDSSDPSNLVAFGKSPQSPEVLQKVFAEGAEKETEKESAKPSSKKLEEEEPWWIKEKHQQQQQQQQVLQKSKSAKSVSAKRKSAEDGDELAPASATEGEEEVEDEQGEEECEWEYYEEEEEEEKAADEEEEGEEEEEEEEEQDRASHRSDFDVREPWIIEGLASLMPKAPQVRRAAAHEEEDEDDEGDYVDGDEDEEEAVSNKESKSGGEQGYKEWLEENAVILNTKIDDLLSTDEEEEEEEGEEEEGGKEEADRKSSERADGEEGGDEEESVEKEKSEEEKAAEVASAQQKERASKAQRLVDKLSRSEGSTLKRILFSLKAIFQSDRNLVYEFVRAGGVAKLVDFGEETVDAAEHGGEQQEGSQVGRDSPILEIVFYIFFVEFQENNQLQNLILRALGQVMLYVDGMNGVMSEPSAPRYEIQQIF